MKCKVPDCSKERIGKKDYCKSHYQRLHRDGEVYADVPFGLHGQIPLVIQRKMLQAKPGYEYCRHCNKYKKAEKFWSVHICRFCRRNLGLKKAYGIDNEGYAKLLKKQKGGCALCRTKIPGKNKNGDQIFRVDHNHKTGKIRGLLCDMCNKNVIGGIEINNVSIVSLIKYLRLSKVELRRISAYVEKEVSNV